ncbi:MAG: hypothetical protein U5K00_06280 [Melioribacteraceae bacterium]|nr:hypothetical protein [Melioribacteraceae bacterium]
MNEHLSCYRKSYEYYSSQNDEIELSVTASKIGSTLSKLGQHDKATKFLKQSNELAKKHNIQNAIYGSMVQLGQNYYSAGNYNDAK